MPLQIVRNDITKMQVDAIVNAANPSLLGGGGVDGAIHKAAGPELLEECRRLGGCPVGGAKLTKGCRLPARYVIHTVGPIWQGGHARERELLERCYENSLRLAQRAGFESVAFPLISSGAYGYPKDQALRVATDTIRRFLMEEEMLVYLVVFDRRAFQISEKLFSDISSYIDDRYAQTHREERRLREERQMQYQAVEADVWDFCMEAPQEAPAPRERLPKAAPRQIFRKKPKAAPKSLNEALKNIDESFSEMLLRLIDERGLEDPYVYKKANIDRKLFGKIRSNRLYKPSKPTVLAFAIALELPLWQTEEMLRKAGFALSPSNPFDIIVEFFISQGNYDIFQINEALFAFDQSLLGG